MKLTGLTTTSISILIAFITTHASAAVCSHSALSFSEIYAIKAADVDDIPGICGGLWDNLNHFGQCAGYIHNPSCGGENRELNWQFTSNSGCQPGMVESAWWEATRNRFGPIDCGSY